MDKELSSMFDEAYACSRVSDKDLPKNTKGRPKERQVVSEKYKSFLRRYNELDKYIDTFKPMDLVYFFREKSRECGNYYSINNMKRDMGIFKRLSLEYSNVEICTMVEFLFESGQKYLPTADLQPTVLNSSWRTTIYKDTVDWVNDVYDPSKKSTKAKSTGAKRNTEREWHKTKQGVTLGDWGDDDE